jgi:hypothetical protein
MYEDSDNENRRSACSGSDTDHSSRNDFKSARPPDSYSIVERRFDRSGRLPMNRHQLNTAESIAISPGRDDRVVCQRIPSPDKQVLRSSIIGTMNMDLQGCTNRPGDAVFSVSADLVSQMKSDIRQVCQKRAASAMETIRKVEEVVSRSVESSLATHTCDRRIEEPSMDQSYLDNAGR